MLGSAKRLGIVIQAIPLTMANKQSKKTPAPARATELPEQVYDLSTPRWQVYYQRLRATVRFPRYYKKALNW